MSKKIVNVDKWLELARSKGRMGDRTEVRYMGEGLDFTTDGHRLHWHAIPFTPGTAICRYDGSDDTIVGQLTVPIVRGLINSARAAIQREVEVDRDALDRVIKAWSDTKHEIKTQINGLKAKIKPMVDKGGALLPYYGGHGYNTPGRDALIEDLKGLKNRLSSLEVYYKNPCLIDGKIGGTDYVFNFWVNVNLQYLAEALSGLHNPTVHVGGHLDTIVIEGVIADKTTAGALIMPMR